MDNVMVKRNVPVPLPAHGLRHYGSFFTVENWINIEGGCLLGCCVIIRVNIALMMEAASTSETSADFYQTTQLNQKVVT
jgi:hypothetical protein